MFFVVVIVFGVGYHEVFQYGTQGELHSYCEEEVYEEIAVSLFGF